MSIPQQPKNPQFQLPIPVQRGIPVSPSMISQNQSRRSMQQPSSMSKQMNFQKEQLLSPENVSKSPLISELSKMKDLSGKLNEMVSRLLHVQQVSSQEAEVLQKGCSDLFQLSTKVLNSKDISTKSQIVERNENAPLLRPLVRTRRAPKNKYLSSKAKTKEEDEEVPKKRKRKVHVEPNMYCHACGAKETPEWRRGPDGCKSLCNACGLHYAKIVKREQECNFVIRPRNNITVSMLLD